MSRYHARSKIRPAGLAHAEPKRRNEHPETIAMRTLYVRNGYHAEQCTGEAHTAPLHHDHCMYCLGHYWGWVAVKDEVTP